MLFIKSPFTPNGIETNCDTYGIREGIIYETIQRLLNDNSILITGTRGIGKSSLQYQLQQILNGDTRILERCNINLKIPKFSTFFYECSENDTLENIISSILQQMIDDIKIHIKKDKKVEIKNAKIGASLGIVNLEIEGGFIDVNNYQNLINKFVDIVQVYNEVYAVPHINIAIDEIDQISNDCQIAHFLKIVLETLDRQKNGYLSFILAGQDKACNMLLKQQPSFHRMVKHFRLEPLDEDITKSVFENCVSGLDRLVEFDSKGLNVLIKLSNGHPYLIQLLGDEAFNTMLKRYETKDSFILKIEWQDCMDAILECLKSNSHRYDNQWLSLTMKERNLLEILINNNDEFYQQIKKAIPQWRENWIVDEYRNTYPNASADEVLEILYKLCHKQILRHYQINLENKKMREIYSFNDEMFRVYLCMNKDVLNENVDCYYLL